MIHVFSTSLTPRLEYVLTFLIKDFFGVDFEVYSDPIEFSQLEGPKISYGKSFDKALYIPSAGLLFESGVRELEIKVHQDKIPKIFYIDKDENFDVLSACFYMLSRYEEYLPFRKDKHGRFSSKESFLLKHDLLVRPLVDEYAVELKNQLEAKFDCKLKDRQYRFIPTYDIDIAYAYEGRNIFRTIGGFGRSLIAMDLKSLMNRLSTITGYRRDPFDTFDQLDKINSKYKLRPIYFFQVGDYGKYDKNVSVAFEPYKALIQKISGQYQIALHPSYRSNMDSELLKKEKQLLESIAGQTITRSRQHFLKLQLPNTYRDLIELGIKEDYSMAFADHAGFRAGTCTAFRFYDLVQEHQTKLVVHPFQVMDTTLRSYMNLDIESAFEQAVRMIDKVKDVEGTYMSLWHNNSLSDYAEWTGWKPLYERIVQYAKSKE